MTPDKSQILICYKPVHEEKECKIVKPIKISKIRIRKLNNFSKIKYPERG